MNNKDIVKREFLKEAKKAYPALLGYMIHVFEAPGAECWVVIADRVAWVAMSDREEFVFWGPKGADPICFEIPQDWEA